MVAKFSVRKIVVLAIFVILVLSTFFFIQNYLAPKQATAKGIVVDENGNPISGAIVKVDSIQVTTASNGSFKVSLKPGQYTLFVSAPGYSNESLKIDLSEAKVYSFNVTLKVTSKPITLYILTRHDTTIQEKTIELFLKSEVAKRFNIVDLKFIPAAGPLWKSYLESGKVDLAWGGGPTLFDSLLNFWAPMNYDVLINILNKLPNDIGGVPMKRFDPNGKVIWVAAAISSFGLTVNKEKLAQWKIDKPTRWVDLASPSLILLPSPQVGIADPTRSTSNTRIYEIILQAYGWEEGWRILTLIAANSKVYDSSDAVREGVISGEIAIGTTIDFYGYTAMMKNPNAEYIIPVNESIVNGDPIALAKGSRNSVAAQAFIAWVLSEGQKIWLDPEINRMPINPEVFSTPEGQKRKDLLMLYNATLKNRGIEFNDTRALLTELAMQSYFKSVLVDANQDLKEAWKAVAALKDKNPEKYSTLRQMLTSLLSFKDPETGQNVSFTEEYAMKISSKLSDPEYLNLIQKVWRDSAIKLYREVLSKASQN